jgi:GNAT superfamily N-acetyltransferase
VDISVTSTHRLPGERVDMQLFQRAWDECVELQQQPKSLWLSRTVAMLACVERYEITASVGDKLIGGVIVGPDDDCHVGRCYSVFAQYVLPEYRLQGVSPKLMRAALRIARSTGSPTFAYTHRQGPWRYETTYRSMQ